MSLIFNRKKFNLFLIQLLSDWEFFADWPCTVHYKHYISIIGIFRFSFWVITSLYSKYRPEETTIVIRVVISYRFCGAQHWHRQTDTQMLPKILPLALTQEVIRPHCQYSWVSQQGNPRETQGKSSLGFQQGNSDTWFSCWKPSDDFPVETLQLLC